MKEIIGKIEHRILLNFRIDPEVMKRNLPSGFEPKMMNGYAIGGICQVSLSQMRLKHLPAVVGLSSHNAAHRVAVKSSEGEGVYVPRRDTNSVMNIFAGGRLFPGVYSKANFDVKSLADKITVEIHNTGGERLMSISAQEAEAISEGSVFKTVEEVSDFFMKGNVGWSPSGDDSYDTIELMTKEWNMKPLLTENVFSSYFSDPNLFPKGSVEFDSAMIMKNLEHSWVSKERLCC